MAIEKERKGHAVNSPFLLIPLLLGVAILFATMTWFAARREMAALYGMVRSIEFPWINKFVPYMEYFKMDSLREGTVPSFTMIYKNSLVFGLLFTALILLVMMLALARLDRFSILRHIRIKSDKGRTYKEVMERMAVTEQSVGFFLDYDIMSLPTTEGTARQPMKADELLLYTNSIQSVRVDQQRREPPKLEIDTAKLRSWMTDRFGPRNPFIDISKRRLLDIKEIKNAVDDLSWYSVLLLYPALYRIHAFNVEDKKGYEKAQQEVEDFISGIWKEINGFKKEFKEGIELGFASDADREERNALYRSRRGAKNKKRKGKAEPLDGEILFAEVNGSTSLDNLTELGRWFRRGQMDRGEVASDALVQRSKAGERPAKKPEKPEHLLFFGEVLSERGPHLKSVETARAKLKDFLTRHLGAQTTNYPVYAHPETGLVVYAKKITNAEQKAFNTKAQERLANAEQAIERVLFNHQFEFSLVGGALEVARKYGIMPPNLFRWLRFCDETTAFWWFVQNLGMPAAYPENAGHYEHYQAEKAMGLAVEQPHIQSAIIGIQKEAERYLVQDRIDELRTILGKDAVVSTVVKADVVSTVMQDFDKLIAKAAKGGATEFIPANKKNNMLGREQIAPGAGTADKATRSVATRASIFNEFDLGDD